MGKTPPVPGCAPCPPAGTETITFWPAHGRPAAFFSRIAAVFGVTPSAGASCVTDNWIVPGVTATQPSDSVLLLPSMLAVIVVVPIAVLLRDALASPFASL
ncbi:MAG: hypothetical protein WDN30_16400 [Pararobbsia sp.]